jgi:DNA topoisomerase-1
VSAVVSHAASFFIRAKVKLHRVNAVVFRTWAGTLICACALARVGIKRDDAAASKKRKIVKAVKETAEILGNTPAVSRSAYICPAVLESFERGEVIEQYFETLDDLVNHRGTQLHRAEKALHRLLKQKSR